MITTPLVLVEHSDINDIESTHMIKSKINTNFYYFLNQNGITTIW